MFTSTSTSSAFDWSQPQQIDSFANLLNSPYSQEDMKTFLTSQMAAPGTSDSSLESPRTRQNSVFSNTQLSPAKSPGFSDSSIIETQYSPKLINALLKPPTPVPESASILFIISTIGSLIYLSPDVEEAVGHSVREGSSFLDGIYPEDVDE